MTGQGNVLKTFGQGEVYLRNRIVQDLSAYIESPAFKGNVAEKRQKIALIAKRSSQFLRLQFKGSGWGASPMNNNCWQDAENPDSESIIIAEVVEQEVEVPDDPYVLPPRDQELLNPVSVKAARARFATKVKSYWGACPITGCDFKKILVASHILPVVECNDLLEIEDHYNGIALTPTFDKLFDAGWITFSDEGQLLYSKKVSPKNILSIGVDAKLIPLPKQSIKYMRYHREHHFKG